MNEFVKLPIKAKSDRVFLPIKRSSPSFGIFDESTTVKKFVAALSANLHDEALHYISKNYAKDFDLDELSEYFGVNYSYKELIKVEFKNKPKNCKTNSILVFEQNKNSIIHLHMIKELDSWKIYSIDKE